MIRRNHRFEVQWLIIPIFAAVLVWAIYTAALGWNNGMALHNFRQTQTAITSYYMVRGGPFLKYETPVLGYPWSVPFEFPLYQWIAAKASIWFHLPLESAGRATSEFFYALSLFAIWGILSELHIRRIHRLVFLIMILVSPQYIYWSRTFMIESTAFFFSAAYLYWILRYVRTRRILDAGCGAICGALGALVKVTTFPAFALVGGLYLAFTLRRDGWNQWNRFRNVVITGLMLFGIPLFIGWGWTSFSDQVKTHNVITNGHLTSAALVTWNFGTIQQRFLLSTWQRMYSQTITELTGNPLLLLLPCVALFAFARHRVPFFLISIAGFLSVFLIFTNVHVIHDHYAYANGAFLLAAVSWCIVGLLEGAVWKQILAVALLVISITSATVAYSGRLYQYQQFTGKNWGLLIPAIQKSTSPSDVIVIFANDWSPELPYYSERRALMWAPWMQQDVNTPDFKEAVANLGNNQIGAAVFCHPPQKLLEDALPALNLAPEISVQEGPCELHLRRNASQK